MSDIEEEKKEKNKLILWFLFGLFWAIFISPLFSAVIRNSDFVTYGGEGEALLAAILQCIIYIGGFYPFLKLWNEKRKDKNKVLNSALSKREVKSEVVPNAKTSDKKKDLIGPWEDLAKKRSSASNKSNGQKEDKSMEEQLL